MSDGKRVMLACSHWGRAIIGQFYLCEQKCDGKVPQVDRCPKCQSTNVRPFEAPSVPVGSMSCWACGKVWFNP